MSPYGITVNWNSFLVRDGLYKNPCVLLHRNPIFHHRNPIILHRNPICVFSFFLHRNPIFLFPIFACIRAPSCIRTQSWSSMLIKLFTGVQKCTVTLTNHLHLYNLGQWEASHVEHRVKVESWLDQFSVIWIKASAAKAYAQIVSDFTVSVKFAKVFTRKVIMKNT